MPNNLIVQNIRNNQYQLKKISTLTELTESINNLDSIIKNSYLLLTNTQTSDNYKIKCELFLNQVYNKINEFIDDFTNGSSGDISKITELLSKLNSLETKLNTLISTHNVDIQNLRSKIGSDISEALTKVYTKTQLDEKLSDIQSSFEDFVKDYIQDNPTSEISEEQLNGLKTELTNKINTLVSTHNSDIQNLRSKIGSDISEALTKVYTKTQLDEKLSDIQSSFKDFIINSINENIEDFARKDDLEQLKTLLTNHTLEKVAELKTLMENNDDNLQSKIDLYNSKWNFYFTKDEIRNLLLTMKKDLNDELLDSLTNEINNKFESEVAQNLLNKINEIKTELNVNDSSNTTYSNSRIDQLEAKIKYLEDNGGFNPIDPIMKIEWINGSIINQKSQYIYKETFEINKGQVIVYYRDGTSKDMTNESTFTVTGGSLSNNIVTIGSSGGKFSIKVSYQNHNSDNSISYDVISPQYYNYFVLINSSKLNEMNYNTEEFLIQYNIGSSLGCPIKESYNYDALGLILEKFYNNESQSLREDKLYMILPKQYCNISNSKLYINNKPLKSNIFEISGISINSEFVVNISDVNYGLKEISYYILEIADSINNGIQLNY